MENKAGTWKEKLSSRKLWAAIVAAAAAVVAAICGESLTPEVVDALGYVTAAAVAYIFGEGAVDAARQLAGKAPGTGE